MKVRIFAVIIACAILIQNVFISAMAGNSSDKTEILMAAKPIASYDSASDGMILYSQPLSNFSTEFNYAAGSNSQSQLSFDFDTTLKKTVYFEDFENYSGSFATAQMNNHGTVGKVTDWSTYDIFSPQDDYDVTMFLAAQNSDWMQMSLYLKDNIYISLKGRMQENGYQLRLLNNDIAVSTFNLDDISEQRRPVGDGSYLRAWVTNDNIKVYLSADSEITEDEIVIDVSLDLTNTSKNSIKLWQGNTGLFFDDVNVRDIHKSGYETVSTEKRTYAEIYKNDFDASDVEIPSGSTLVDDEKGGKALSLNDWQNYSANMCASNGNYRLDFFLQSNNFDWDWIDISIRDNINLCFRGSKNSNGNYTAKLMNGNEALSSNTECVMPVNSGCYIRIEFNNGKIDVYTSSTYNFDNSISALSANVDNYTPTGDFVINKNNIIVHVDDVALYNLDDYTSETKTTSNGEYNMVSVSNDQISINHVTGSTVTCVASVNTKIQDSENTVGIVRYMENVTVFLNGNNILTAALPFDENNYKGSLQISTTEKTISDIKVYDSGKIDFEGEYPRLSQLELDDIKLLTSSYNNGSLSFKDGKLIVDGGDVNGSVTTTNWLKEEAGDFVMEFDVLGSRNDWVSDQFYFSVPGKVTSSTASGVYQWSADELYKNGYVAKFGADGANQPVYGFSVLKNSLQSDLSSLDGKAPYFWGSTKYRVRIVKKCSNIKIYCYCVDTAESQPVLIEEYENDSFSIGNFYWYHRQGSSEINNISVYDTENREQITINSSEDYNKKYADYLKSVNSYLKLLKSGERYSDDDIYIMKQYADSASNKSANQTNYNDLKSVFEAFLNHGKAQLTFAMASDSHMTDVSKLLTHTDKIQAYVNCGDSTNCASAAEWETVNSNIPDSLRGKCFIALGNGEINTPFINDYSLIAKQFIDEMGAALPDEIENPYYSGSVNGYKFIVLSTEKQQPTPYYSDEQLSWLDSQLSDAVSHDADKPVFVVSHFPANQTLIGTEMSEKLNGVLGKYKNQVQLLSGYLHNNISDELQSNCDYGYNNINVPSFADGYGYITEIYNDSIVYRAFDVSEGVYAPDYDLIYYLQNGSYVLQQRIEEETETKLVAKYDFSDGKSPITLHTVGNLNGNTPPSVKAEDGVLKIENGQGHGFFSSSFIEDQTLKALNWSFKYSVTDCHWMTNEFYMLAKNGNTDNCYLLRIAGSGAMAWRSANIQLIRRTNGQEEILDTANCTGIIDGNVYSVNISISKTDISVRLRPDTLDDDEAIVLRGSIDPTHRYKGGLYIYAWDPCKINISDMEIYDGADISAFKAAAISTPTQLINYYNANKTAEPIPVNQPANAGIEKPWYKFTNQHSNAMFLEKSLSGDRALRDFKMSFTYLVEDSFWMTNEIYLASSNSYGNSCYLLRIRGWGTAGLFPDQNNVQLIRKYNGKEELLDSVEIKNITDGAFKFDITCKSGDISISVSSKNDNGSNVYTLNGSSGDKVLIGGIYMYAYDNCIIYLKDILIYDGANTDNSEKPDMLIEKKIYVNTDFSDGKAPVRLYKDENSEIKIDSEVAKLNFNTNDNHYIQTDGFTKETWLEDYTVEFDYSSLYGAWNITRFAVHTKSGDLYHSVYLSILGTMISDNVDHGDNYAKVQGANIQLIKSIYGVKTCMGYASLPDISDGRTYRIKITGEGGNVKVYAWPAKESAILTPIIAAYIPDAEVSFGDFYVHDWCSKFNMDNLLIKNYADNSESEFTDASKNKTGEIIRVDRVYEKQLKDKVVQKDEPQTNTNNKNTVIVLACICATVAILAGIVTCFYIKNRRKKESSRTNDLKN